MLRGVPAMSAFVPTDTIPHHLCNFLYEAALAAGFNGRDDDGDLFVTTSWTYKDANDYWEELCSTSKPLTVTRAFYLYHRHSLTLTKLLSSPRWAYWKYVK